MFDDQIMVILYGPRFGLRKMGTGGSTSSSGASLLAVTAAMVARTPAPVASKIGWARARMKSIGGWARARMKSKLTDICRPIEGRPETAAAKLPLEPPRGSFIIFNGSDSRSCSEEIV
jgi:hypothetical protein